MQITKEIINNPEIRSNLSEAFSSLRSGTRNAKHCQSSKTTIWANALSVSLSQSTISKFEIAFWSDRRE